MLIISSPLQVIDHELVAMTTAVILRLLQGLYYYNKLSEYQYD